MRGNRLAAAVQRARPNQWQALVVGVGDAASANRSLKVWLETLAEDGHEVIDAHCDAVAPKGPRVVRRPS